MAEEKKQDCGVRLYYLKLLDRQLRILRHRRTHRCPIRRHRKLHRLERENSMTVSAGAEDNRVVEEVAVAARGAESYPSVERSHFLAETVPIGKRRNPLFGFHQQ